MLEFAKNTVAILLVVVVIYICGFSLIQLLESAFTTVVFYKAMSATFSRIKAKAYKTK